MLHVEILNDKNKIEKQIIALEYQLTQDINEIDREIHYMALHELRKALSEFKKGDFKMNETEYYGEYNDKLNKQIEEGNKEIKEVIFKEFGIAPEEFDKMSIEDKEYYVYKVKHIRP